MKISDLTLKLESRNKVTGLLHRKQASIEIKGLGDVFTNLHEIKAMFCQMKLLNTLNFKMQPL